MEGAAQVIAMDGQTSEILNWISEVVVGTKMEEIGEQKVLVRSVGRPVGFVYKRIFRICCPTGANRIRNAITTTKMKEKEKEPNPAAFFVVHGSAGGRTGLRSPTAEGAQPQPSRSKSECKNARHRAEVRLSKRGGSKGKN